MSEVNQREITQRITELEDEIKKQQVLADYADQAVALNKHHDFRKLILEGFCLHEAARYAQESGDPFLTPGQRQDALNMSQASGHLKRFLSITIQMGNMADSTIAGCKAELESLRGEA